MKIPQFYQHTDFTCGPTSLRMAFAFFGVELSEKHLRFEAHTNKEVGTHHLGMIESARHHGFYVYANNNSSLIEIEYVLKMNRPVIIHYLEPFINEGHYALVHRISKNKLYLSDPWFGKRLSFSHDDFLKRWKSEDGRHPQWLMAIGKTPFVEGHEYTPHIH
ncbi:MAG TPA: cysteine peptidase family C39 domain-containing protein [Candidatus Paceibacterota bacterium]|nr:cysteine peptidase family C39 domain-containing protein [Candidatus Paceibacterota bacterium]